MARLGILFNPAAVARPCEFSELPDIPAIARLKSRRQWVCWRYEDRGGPKPTKVPYQPGNGFKASVSTPHHWGTYDQAVARAERARMDGVGFVLADDDELTGIDLDHCRDENTGDLSPLAQRIADLAETYCEVTPSETGLRLIVEGKIASALKRDPVGVEMYGKGRYLTITGWHLPSSPKEVRPAPQTLEALREAVAAFDAEEAEKTAAVALNSPSLAAPLSSREEGGSPFFRNVNTAALASLAAWVPAIFGAAAKFHPGTGAYRVSSKSLSRNLEEDLSIAPNGIRDWGVGDMGDGRQGARTPIDLVLEYGFESEPRAAAIWLCSQMGKDPASFGYEDSAAEGASIAASLLARQVVKAEDGTLSDAKTGEIIAASTVSPGDVLDTLSLGRDVDWTRPGGLIEAMAEWILNSARRPNRPMAVAAATAVLSAVCGRHLFAPSGTALNLYIVCLAGTTVGKGRPLSAIAELLKAAGLGLLQTTGKGFSVSSVEQMMTDHPACVATIDEIGANLLGRMSNKNANTHEQAMRGALLELWSREQGQDAFFTHRKANASPVAIESPSLTIYGASTSEAFYGAVTSGSVKDGFLNRFLLAHAAPRAKSREVPEHARTVPASIIHGLLSIIPNGLTDFAAALSGFLLAGRPKAVRLEWDGPESKARAAAFEEEILDVMDASPEHSSLMGRVFEYSVRLATLRAVSRDGRSAKVGIADLEWGAAWAISSAKAMINGAGAQMAASDYEQKFNAVRNALQEAKLLTRQELLRQVRSVSAREREDIIKHLKEGGWIEEVSMPTGGRTAVGWRWVG